MQFLQRKHYKSDKPEVTSSKSSPYTVTEGETASLSCTLTDANPRTSIIWRWIKTDSYNIVFYNGPNYTIPSIQRGKAGSYSCTASNIVGTSEAATIYVNVQCRLFSFTTECSEAFYHNFYKTVAAYLIQLTSFNDVKIYQLSADDTLLKESVLTWIGSQMFRNYSAKATYEKKKGFTIF